MPPILAQSLKFLAHLTLIGKMAFLRKETIDPTGQTEIFCNAGAGWFLRETIIPAVNVAYRQKSMDNLERITLSLGHFILNFVSRSVTAKLCAKSATTKSIVK